MNLLIVLICLGIERFFDLTPKLARFGWFQNYMAWGEKQLGKFGSWALLAVWLVPLPLITYILYYGLEAFLFGLISYVISFLVLIYCLGPTNFFEKVTHYLDARKLNNDDECNAAVEAFAGEQAAKKAIDRDQQMTLALFSECNDDLVAAIFWYALLGPVMAVFYRILSLTLQKVSDSQAEAKEFMALIKGLLDWLPSRLLALIYALCGHFVTGFNYWRQEVFSGLSQTNDFLQACGSAALDYKGDVEDGVAQLNGAYQLVKRALIVLLVIYALIVIL